MDLQIWVWVVIFVQFYCYIDDVCYFCGLEIFSIDFINFGQIEIFCDFR